MAPHRARGACFGCSGWQNAILQAGWLQQENCVFSSSFWSPRSRGGQVSVLPLACGWQSPHCPRMAYPLFESIPFSSYENTHQIGLEPNGLILT